ncbi:MAG: HemK2/MTQ2 family protein methyltransferase [Thermoplasmata archaeon]
MTASDPVYPPRADSLLLVPYAQVPRGTSVLEIGTGGGIASLAAARCGARVVATDRNPYALRRVRRVARAENLDLETVRTDLARGLGRFDRILANPPYLPTATTERDPDRWHNLALDAGPDGTRTSERILDQLPEHLAPHASAYLVGSSLQTPAAVRRLLERWRARGGLEELVVSRRVEGETLEVRRFSFPSATSREPQA